MIDPISWALIGIGSALGCGGAGFAIKKFIAKCSKKQSDTHDTATVRIAHPDGTTVELHSVSEVTNSSLEASAMIDLSDDEPKTVGQSLQNSGLPSRQQTPLQKLVSAVNEVYSPQSPTSPSPQSAFDDDHVQLRLSQGDRKMSLVMKKSDASQIPEILVAADGFLSRSHTPTPPITPKHFGFFRSKMQDDCDSMDHANVLSQPIVIPIHCCRGSQVLTVERGSYAEDDSVFPLDGIVYRDSMSQDPEAAKERDDTDVFPICSGKRKVGLFKREETAEFDSQMSIVGAGSSFTIDDEPSAH